RRGLDALNASLGWAVGDLFARRYFPPAAKAQVQAMVVRLKEAFATRLRTLSWMQPKTRTQALEKLARTQVKIGYPDRPRDISRLRIDAGDLYGNVERSRGH